MYMCIYLMALLQKYRDRVPHDEAMRAGDEDALLLASGDARCYHHYY